MAISHEQALVVIRGAESLKKLDELENDPVLKKLLSNYSTNDSIEREDVIAVAEGLGIERKYVEKYLSMAYPTIEEQRATAKKWKARPDVIMLAHNAVFTYKSRLIQTLNSSLEGKRFMAYSIDYYDLEFRIGGLPKDDFWVKLFFWENRIMKKTNLDVRRMMDSRGEKFAEFKYHHRKPAYGDSKAQRAKIEFEVFHQSFLPVCAETLSQLEKDIYWADLKRPVQHYVIPTPS